MKPKLLIIEDQTEIRKLIRLSLEMGDYELHEAHDAETGLDAFRRVQPDVVLLDVMMPGSVGGYELCRTFKADPAASGVKVIFLSARGQKADLAQGEAAGGDEYLVKPFSPLALIETINRVLKD